MIGDGIHEGDLLVVDRSMKACSGKVVVAVVDGDLLVKRLLEVDGRPTLVSSNPDFPPIKFSGDSQLEIWGIVTHVIHYL